MDPILPLFPPYLPEGILGPKNDRLIALLDILENTEETQSLSRCLGPSAFQPSAPLVSAHPPVTVDQLEGPACFPRVDSCSLPPEMRQVDDHESSTLSHGPTVAPASVPASDPAAHAEPPLAVRDSITLWHSGSRSYNGFGSGSMNAPAADAAVRSTALLELGDFWARECQQRRKRRAPALDERPPAPEQEKLQRLKDAVRVMADIAGGYPALAQLARAKMRRQR